jgi:hypothetical protein
MKNLVINEISAEIAADANDWLADRSNKQTLRKFFEFKDTEFLRSYSHFFKPGSLDQANGLVIYDGKRVGLGKFLQQWIDVI